MPYVRVNQYLYWCGDSYMYNRLVDIRKHPHKCAGEHLIDYTQCYAYGMFLDYNSTNTPGKGSAIFLHCKGNSGYTADLSAEYDRNPAPGDGRSKDLHLSQVIGEMDGYSDFC